MMCHHPATDARAFNNPEAFELYLQRDLERRFQVPQDMPADMLALIDEIDLYR